MEHEIKLISIARRRWRGGGTRYNCRGLDDDGNVANFTEVEQIVIKHYIQDKKDEQEDEGTSTVTSQTRVVSYL